MSEYQYYEFAAMDGPISDKGLRYACRDRLHRIGHIDAPQRAVTQQLLEAWRVLWRRDEKDVPDPGEHHSG